MESSIVVMHRNIVTVPRQWRREWTKIVQDEPAEKTMALQTEVQHVRPFKFLLADIQSKNWWS